MYLLFNLIRPWDWTEAQTANVISLLSAIATVGALWYAIVQGIRNSKKINDLAEISKQLAEQNKLQIEQNEMHRISIRNSIHPTLNYRWAGYDGPLKVIYVINLTNTALISKIEGTDFILKPEFKPCTLHEKTRQEVYGIPQSNQWSITVYYEDMNRNKFSQVFEVKGLENTFTHAPVPIPS